LVGGSGSIFDAWDGGLEGIASGIAGIFEYAAEAGLFVIDEFIADIAPGIAGESGAEGGVIRFVDAFDEGVDGV
jgi:hypothetical protein